MLIRLCWSINPSTPCWSIPVILFDGPVKSYLIPRYSNVELLFIALFSLMLTPEAAAAALRRPWSSVLLPQRTRALGTQFTVLKLEKISQSKMQFETSDCTGITGYSLPPWMSCHLQAASLTQRSRWLQRRGRAPRLESTENHSSDGATKTKQNKQEKAPKSEKCLIVVDLVDQRNHSRLY